MQIGIFLTENKEQEIKVLHYYGQKQKVYFYINHNNII